MGGAEGVVDVEIGQGRANCRQKAGSFFSSPAWKRRFSRSRTSPSRRARRQFFDLGADTVGGHGHRAAEQLLQVGGNRSEAVFGVRLSLGPAEVGGEDQPSALGEDVADGRQGGDDPRIIGYASLVVEGDVEIDSAEDPFALSGRGLRRSILFSMAGPPSLGIDWESRARRSAAKKRAGLEDLPVKAMRVAAGQEAGQIDDAVGITPLVVVPGEHLDHVAADDRGGQGIDGRRGGAALKSMETSGSSQ